MQANSVEDLISALQAATASSEVWSSAATFFDGFGIDRLIYMDVGLSKPRVMSTMPDSWIDHYTEHNHARIDPFIRYCASTLQPIGTGIDYLDDHTYLDRRERDFICGAAEAGFRSGMSCMIRPRGPAEIVGWNLDSSLPRQEMEHIFLQHGHLLRLAAHFSHEKLAKFESEDEGEARMLSPRETECLQWLSSGLRTKEIADRMGIRSVTVELHLRNARTKLAAQTREQAIARAFAAGVLTI